MSALEAVLRIPASFWRFGLVGVGGLFVDMAVLYAVMWSLGLGPVPAKVFSFLAAATFTWWMNRRYTFGGSGKSLLCEWAGFLATNAVGGVVNFAVYTTLVAQFTPHAWLPALATAMGSLSGLMFNYTASRHLVFNTTRGPHALRSDVDEAAPPLPGVAYPLALAVCLGFGCVALGLGMDANWDLRNYHWYNGWAYANGLVGRDLLVSQLPSFYNPTLDAVYALGVERLPARAIGFALGMAHGLNFLLLLAIAWRLSTLADPRRRLAVSAAAALTGMAGAGGMAEVGTVFYDDLLSLGVFAAVLLVISHWDKLAAGKGAIWVLAAGIPAGLAFGLKQPMAIYCLGLCAAFLVAAMPWRRRALAGFWFGIGALFGFAAGGGRWAWHLWQAYGNPLFPFFNQVFLSPWGLPIDYRDDGFLHHSLAEKLLLVWRFSFNSRLAGEIDFRDFRIMVLMTLLPLTALARALRRQEFPFTRPGPTGWLLAAALAVYALWVPAFSIYRYLVPLEMLSPVLIVAAIGLLPGSQTLRGYATAALLGALVLTTIPGDWQRVPWEDNAVPVDVPAIAHPEQTLVLLSGREPLSFLIPAFPRSMRFYRIESNFEFPDDPDDGFYKVFRDAVRKHQGPVASLHSVAEQPGAARKLAVYGLELVMPSCRPVSSPLGGEVRYAFCLTRRLGAPR